MTLIELVNTIQADAYIKLSFVDYANTKVIELSYYIKQLYFENPELLRKNVLTLKAIPTSKKAVIYYIDLEGSY